MENPLPLKSFSQTNLTIPGRSYGLVNMLFTQNVIYGQCFRILHWVN